MRVRRKKHDDIFSKLVRERANWTCQACGENKKFHAQTLDCAHLVSRRHVGLRWHPRNAVALCRSCHMFYTEHPFDWADWCVDHFGEDLIGEIRLVASKPVKWNTTTREAIYQHYRSEYDRLLKRREKWPHLILDFEPHEVMHVFKSSPRGTKRRATA